MRPEDDIDTDDRVKPASLGIDFIKDDINICKSEYTWVIIKDYQVSKYMMCKVTAQYINIFPRETGIMEAWKLSQLILGYRVLGLGRI